MQHSKIPSAAGALYMTSWERMRENEVQNRCVSLTCCSACEDLWGPARPVWGPDAAVWRVWDTLHGGGHYLHRLPVPGGLCRSRGAFPWDHLPAACAQDWAPQISAPHTRQSWGKCPSATPEIFNVSSVNSMLVGIIPLHHPQDVHRWW